MNLKIKSKLLLVLSFFLFIHLLSCEKKSLKKEKRVENLRKGEERVKMKNLEQNVDHKVRGEEFLKLNKKKDGVQVTASGLQYKVVKMGAGKKPKKDDTVRVHYKGTLIDGVEFDSSYKRGQPIEFPLNRVIKGWTEGLQLMKEGSKYIFYIPSELGYGKRGAPPRIPGDSTLVFDIELLKVISKK